MSAYVITAWSAQDSTDLSGNYVMIRGREGGLISWILSLMHIEPSVCFEVKSDKIIFKEGSFQGHVQFITPLENVCNTFYGYTKPVKEAIIMGVIVGMLTFFLAGIPGIIVGILYYFLNKTLTVGYTDMGGLKSHINFKRSVIERKNIDENAAKQVCEIIQRLIEKKTASSLAISAGEESHSNGASVYYFADENGQAQGPYNINQLKAKADNNVIHDQTPVIKEGDNEWKQYSDWK